jgi:hypothetical protein
MRLIANMASAALVLALVACDGAIVEYGMRSENHQGFCKIPEFAGRANQSSSSDLLRQLQ